MQQRSVPALIGAAAALTAVIWALERRRRDEKGAKEGATLARVVYHTRRWWHRSTKTVALRDARALGSSLDKNGAATATFAPLAEKDVGVALDTESVARDLFPAAERLLEKRTTGGEITGRRSPGEKAGVVATPRLQTRRVRGRVAAAPPSRVVAAPPSRIVRGQKRGLQTRVIGRQIRSPAGTRAAREPSSSTTS